MPPLFAGVWVSIAVGLLDQHVALGATSGVDITEIVQIYVLGCRGRDVDPLRCGLVVGNKLPISGAAERDVRQLV